MDKDMLERLETVGWKARSAEEFLKLSLAEAALIDTLFDDLNEQENDDKLAATTDIL